MNKADLVDKIACETQLTKSSVEAALNKAIDIIKQTVKTGDDVTLSGFGTFTRTHRRERAGRNPRTGHEMTIPATTVPRFRPGKEFRELVVK